MKKKFILAPTESATNQEEPIDKKKGWGLRLLGIIVICVGLSGAGVILNKKQSPSQSDHAQSEQLLSDLRP
ncbi:hypothetical protein N9165_00105 [Akkermansiaceae bacterium]|nr:hypothetical protein [Akkermansiaceae bacterium]